MNGQSLKALVAEHGFGIRVRSMESEQNLLPFTIIGVNPHYPECYTVRYDDPYGEGPVRKECDNPAYNDYVLA